MKPIVLVCVVLAACVALFFFAPYRLRIEYDSIDTTLAQSYAKFFSDAPELNSPRLIFFMLLGCSGIFAAFYPVIFAALAAWRTPTEGRPGGALFGLGGFLALFGVAANFALMLISNMNFMSGGSSVRKETPFVWLILVFQILFAIASLVMGFSASFAQFVTRLIQI